MKQRIGFLFLFALLFCFLKGQAEENEYTLTYEYDTEKAEATVTGYTGTPVNVVVPPEVTDENGNNFVVKYVGINALRDCNSVVSVELPESVISIEGSAFNNCISLSSVDLPKSLISIGRLAFYECESLSSIEIPEGVTSIGAYAFFGCSSLISIVLPDGVTEIETYTFDDCRSLTSIVLPKNLTSIGDSAFSGCNSLTSIEFPSTLTIIGNGSFYGCYSLSSLKLPAELTSIGNSAFYGCRLLATINLPEGINYIGDSAFYGCNLNRITYLTDTPLNAGNDIFKKEIYNLPDVLEYPLESKKSFMETAPWCNFFSAEREDNIFYAYNGDYAEVIAYNTTKDLGAITIPQTVVDEEGNSFIVNRIGNASFRNCESLTSVNLPEGLTSIGVSAFRDCTALVSVNLPETLTSIENYAFYGCYSLNSINFPPELTSIGINAFYHCKSLTSVELPETITSILGGTFGECDKLTSIILPSGLTSIDWNAFYFCRSLSSIEFPESLTYIGQQAFYGCRSLTSINLPNGITIIPGSFYGCRSLTSIVLPKSLTTIYENTFEYCPLEKINYLTQSPITTSENVFLSDVYETAILEIPKGAREAFMTTTPWNLFKNIVEVETGNEEEQSYTLKYRFNEDGTATVIGYEGDPVDVIVPEEVEGDNGNKYEVSSIGNEVFANCSSLVTIALPEGLRSIGSWTFCQCNSLTTINIPEGLTAIGNSAFAGCKSLLSIELPDRLTAIEPSLFEGCTSLISIKLPNSLTYIDYGVFKGCTSLTHIDFPKGLMYIGNDVFLFNTSLTSLILPESLTFLGDRAFISCPLEKITYLTASPISAEENIFDSEVHETAVLEIPKGAREAFMATTPWNLFKNIMEVEEEEPEPQPGEKYHLLTVNITNGFSAELSVKEGEKAAVALNLDEWWEPGEVKFNGEPLEVTASKIHTPEMTEPATLEITPRFKGDVTVLDYATGIVDIENRDIQVMTLIPGNLIILGLEIGDEVAVYTVAGHLVTSASASNTEMSICDLPTGTTYIVRVNSSAFKIMM